MKGPKHGRWEGKRKKKEAIKKYLGRDGELNIGIGSRKGNSSVLDLRKAANLPQVVHEGIGFPTQKELDLDVRSASRMKGHTGADSKRMGSVRNLGSPRIQVVTPNR